MPGFIFGKDSQIRSTGLASPAPCIPSPRGPRTAHLIAHLARPPHELPPLPAAIDDPLAGNDSALALYMAYELHYRSFAGVDDRWEWEPSLLRQRAQMEAEFEACIFTHIDRVPVAAHEVVPTLRMLSSSDSGPSLSAWMYAVGTLDHAREFAIHRSAYQLKEADPHTWVVPRISGDAKAALVAIQSGEYGTGLASQVHSTLFADTMQALDLDSTYGAYIDHIPGVTLATVNLMSLFGLHRRWRGATVGHLALFEMCSVVPMGRYAAALRRLGAGEGAPFYDAHVVADAEHEVIALYDMAGSLAVDEPALAVDIVFGARALQFVEQLFAQHLLDAWDRGGSSLRPAIAVSPAA